MLNRCYGKGRPGNSHLVWVWLSHPSHLIITPAAAQDFLLTQQLPRPLHFWAGLGPKGTIGSR